MISAVFAVVFLVFSASLRSRHHLQNLDAGQIRRDTNSANFYQGAGLVCAWNAGYPLVSWIGWL